MEPSRILRSITQDGSFMATVMDSTQLVCVAQEIHRTSPVATAALGRLLTASSLMGNLLKKPGASITLKIKGGGPLGVVVAVADSRGRCRGYVENPKVQAPLRPDGKLDVGGVVGNDGALCVIRDFGEGEPYTGQVALVSGEIGEDIAAYYARSEQIPTVCGLGVLLDKADGEVLLAGGFLLQALPGADDAALARLEENVRRLDPVTTMLAKGMGIEDICRQALDGFAMEVLDTQETGYACPCSKERVIRAVCSLPAKELREMAEQDGKMEACCQYCGKTYVLTREELLDLAEKSGAKARGFVL